MKTARILIAALLIATNLIGHADNDALRHTTDVMCLLPDASN